MLLLCSNYNYELWGNVSDWVIAMATVSSMFFLLWTLRSQIKVQKMQLKSLNIENARFLREQNLMIPVDIISCQPYKLGVVSIRITFGIKITIQNANFKKLKLSFNKNVILRENQPQEFEFLYNGDVIDYYFSIELPYQEYLDNENEVEIALEVVDYADNTLLKKTLITYKNGGYGIVDRNNGFEKIDV